VLTTVRSRQGYEGQGTTARFVVHLASESEAHRLVRQWHLTPYTSHVRGNNPGQQFVARARLIN
jgi:hypothetical protein